MTYEKTYDRSLASEWDRAYMDADWYNSQLEIVLAEAILQGATRAVCQFAAQFGGVQGFPVEVMCRRLKAELSQTS